MIDIMLIFWLVLFIIFIVINISQQSTTFGIIAGFWFMLLGVLLVTTGVQIQTGVNTSISGDYQLSSFSYSDATMPFSTYSYVWGVFIVAISIYLIYANGMKWVK